MRYALQNSWTLEVSSPFFDTEQEALEAQHEYYMFMLMGDDMGEEYPDMDIVEVE